MVLPDRRFQPLAPAGGPGRHRSDAAPRGVHHGLRTTPSGVDTRRSLGTSWASRWASGRIRCSTTISFPSYVCILCALGYLAHRDFISGTGGNNVNKAELIEALSARLGDKKSANAALDAVLAEIQAAVTKGDKVAITGFGVFEKRVRGARTARNPRTGEAVKVKKTSVPAFRAGASFREMVAAGKVPKVAPAKKAAATKTAAAKATTA